jgi:hypothetical protein
MKPGDGGLVSGSSKTPHLRIAPAPGALPCRIPATNRETLAGFSPQTAKPETIAAKYA